MIPTADAYLFDMDGVLTDSMPFHVRAWRAFLSDHGVELTAQEFLDATGGGMTNAEILRSLLRADLADDALPALMHDKEVRYRSLFAPELRPTPGLHTFLDRARERGTRTALVTSAGEDNIAFVLGGLALLDRFDVRVGARDVRRGKPDPEPYRLAAERLGLAPERCLVFEDSPAGFASAHAAGMQVVAVTSMLSAADARAYPSVAHAIADFTELAG